MQRTYCHFCYDSEELERLLIPNSSFLLFFLSAIIRASCSQKLQLNARYERDYWQRVAERGKLLMMKLPKLTAVIEPGEDGWYVASCPELGIVSQGETPEHAEEMIKEAVELWLECAEESEVRRRLNERKVAIKELEVTHG
jgi:predicted RNase H-like HicB family nuclease